MPLLTNLLGLPAVVWIAIVVSIVALVLIAVVKELNTREISVIAVLVSTCLASNYALIWLPNVKVMDLIVFVSGLQFGASIGGIVAILVWAIYGSINPYGFVLPIWVGCMVAESLFGVTGGLIGAWIQRGSLSCRKLSWEMAIVGFLLTFVYDLFTNVLSAITISWFETSLETILLVIVSGIPFAAIHEVSNGILFLLGVGPISSSIQKIAGGGTDVSR
jgi:hypothetical protein